MNTKVISLVKLCTEIQLAHLYEHLYLRAVVRFFKEQGLVGYIDYFWECTTYHGGIVDFDFTLKTSRAQKFASRLSKLTIPMDNETIKSSLAEITAEEKVLLGTRDDLARSGLEKVQAQPWQTIDEFGYLNARKVRRSRRAVWTSDMPARTKILRSEFALDDSLAMQRPELLPLFTLICDVFQNNSNELGERGYYSAGDTVSSNNGTKHTMCFRAWVDYIPGLTDELYIYRSEIAHLLELNVVSKIAHYLQNLSYETQRYVPSQHRRYKATLIFIGAAGWSELATEDNIREVLKHTTLQLTFGREKQSLKLRELIT